jgi:hypothetical protein
MSPPAPRPPIPIPWVIPEAPPVRLLPRLPPLPVFPFGGFPLGGVPFGGIPFGGLAGGLLFGKSDGAPGAGAGTPPGLAPGAARANARGVPNKPARDGAAPAEIVRTDPKKTQLPILMIDMMTKTSAMAVPS